VVHVFPTFAVGGAQARFATLANRFGRDFRHLVVALDGNTAARSRLAPDLDVQFPPVLAPKDAMLGNAWRFRGLLRQWEPDLLVTCNWGAIEFALANFWPVSRHIHVEDGFGPEERSGQIRRRGLVRRLALSRSTVVLPSRTLERIATEQWRLPRTVYVPNGIDLARFSPAPPRSGPVVTIGTVAALREEKNIGRLLAAFAQLAAERAVRLVIVGDGPQRPALEAEVAARALGELVTFTGQRSDTPALYAGFDIFALSSDTEQMPLSVLEAMASGLPIASTDVGDVRTILAPENAAFVVPLDADALASTLRTLAEDSALRGRLGAANRLRAAGDFDEAVMARRWRALWDGTACPG
jgi:glycosyltransferase involved in cell wall biosynthesis